MTARGTVRVWHAEEGWGLLDAAHTPGGCWAHFSAVLVGGYRALEAGQAVEFTFEAAEQDGHLFRALQVWPVGSPPGHALDQRENSAAYRSTLILTFDDEAGPDAP